MNITISQLNDHLSCPQLSHNRHVLRRGLSGTSPALELGTAVHAYMAARLQGAPPPKLVLGPDGLSEMASLGPFLDQWKAPTGWKVLMVEQALSTPLTPEIELLGRLDALIEWNGGYWSLQWKTCKQGTSMVHYPESVRLSFHEAAYQHLAEARGYLPFHGTILVTIQKLSGAAQSRGTHPLAEHYLPRTKAEQHRLMDSIRWGAEGLAKQTNIIRNTNSCWGRWGKSPCEYFGVCHGSKQLDKAPYVELKPRYAEGEGDEVHASGTT